MFQKVCAGRVEPQRFGSFKSYLRKSRFLQDKGEKKLILKEGTIINFPSVSPQTEEDNHIQEVLIQEHLCDKSQEDKPKNEKAVRADDDGVPVKLWNE